MRNINKVWINCTEKWLDRDPQLWNCNIYLRPIPVLYHCNIFSGIACLIHPRMPLIQCLYWTTVAFGPELMCQKVVFLWPSSTFKAIKYLEVIYLLRLQLEICISYAHYVNSKSVVIINRNIWVTNTFLKPGFSEHVF